jgi:hypothetical protein
MVGRKLSELAVDYCITARRLAGARRRARTPWSAESGASNVQWP